MYLQVFLSSSISIGSETVDAGSLPVRAVVGSEFSCVFPGVAGPAKASLSCSSDNVNCELLVLIRNLTLSQHAERGSGVS